MAKQHPTIAQHPFGLLLTALGRTDWENSSIRPSRGELRTDLSPQSHCGQTSDPDKLCEGQTLVVGNRSSSSRCVGEGRGGRRLEGTDPKSSDFIIESFSWTPSLPGDAEFRFLQTRTGLSGTACRSWR